MPTIECEACGSPFHIRPSRVGIRRRCSVACADTRIDIACVGCGVMLSRPAWHRRMSEKPFCTFRCRDDWRIRSRHDAYPIMFDRLETWSADLAYFIGLMLTDGNIITAGPVSFVSLDECSTRFVRDFIAPGTPIRIETTKAANAAYRWSVYSGKLVAALSQLGLTPRKSLTIEMPAIPEAFLWDFVRGVLDGDGHVDQAGRATFSTGSERFANGLTLLFTLRGLRVTMRRRRRAWSVDLNVPSSRTLAGLIYRDGCPHLARKRARFRNIPELSPPVRELFLT